VEAAGIESKLATLTKSLDAHLDKFNKTQTDLRGLTITLETQQAAEAEYAKVADQLAALEGQIATTEALIKKLGHLDRLFGDKGIKALKLYNAIGAINDILRRDMEIISGGLVKVTISPSRQKQDGDTTIDISIMVAEGPKEEIPLQMYSGGEKQQITLAIVNALSEYAWLNGVGFNILCMDEIFGPLDETAAGAVFKYLEHLKSRGRSSIFITTHNDNVKDQLKFDHILTVTKQNHQAQAVVAAPQR
jgi:DNA repair exonuclease SbcCD ATPase subunit